MSRNTRDRMLRKLDEAEGYLMLEMPARALQILEARDDWGPHQFEASFLLGEALRSEGRFRDALLPLERAAALKPEHLGVAISLGWCYKRTHRLAQAIDALERAAREHPEEPLLHYNLACYWSLVGNAPKAIEALGMALDLDPSLRERIGAESDFQTLHAHPEFARLVDDTAPLA